MEHEHAMREQYLIDEGSKSAAVSASKIIERDSARVANYRESLRGYQVREDILSHLAEAVDLDRLPKSGSIVMADFGCGPGIVGLHLRKQLERQMTGRIRSVFLDVSEAMLKQIPMEEGIEKVRGDVARTPFPDCSFDIVVMKQVLDYLPEEEQRRAIAEMYRTLKSNGQLILSALISPDATVNELTNALYTDRERIIGRVPIRKFIPDRDTLQYRISEAGFHDIQQVYRYDIPLSVEDFRVSFGLDEEKVRALTALYQKIAAKDTQGYFRAGEEKNSPQLVEQGLVIHALKKNAGASSRHVQREVRQGRRLCLWRDG